MNDLVVIPGAYKHLKVNSSLFLVTPITDWQAVINGILSLLAFALCDYPCNRLIFSFYPMEISLANKPIVLSYSCIILNTKSAAEIFHFGTIYFPVICSVAIKSIINV